MTRRAIVGFLVFAGLVGAAQTLSESQLAGIGDRLLTLQATIDAGSRYTRMGELLASPGCLWTKVDVVNTYDACDGPSYDWNGYSEGASVIVPQAYTSYVTTPAYTTDVGTWNQYNPYTDPYQLQQYQYTEAPSGYTNYGYQTVPMDTSYVYSGSNYGSGYGGGYGNFTEAPITYDYGYGTNNYYTGSSASYGSTGSYGSYGSYGTPVTYADTWYTQALPGVGQAIIPLLPPAYQPTSYSTGYSVGASLSYGGYYEPAQQQTAPPTCSITLSPSDIAYGGSTMASWITRDATTASLNEVGAVPLSGTKTFTGQTTSRTIGLTVARGGRVGACYALLEVAPLASTQPNCVIAAYPEEIQRGQSATLGWRVNNGTSASLSGYGSVAREGVRTVSPTQTTTYVLTVQGGGRTATCSKAIFVQ